MIDLLAGDATTIASSSKTGQEVEGSSFKSDFDETVFETTTPTFFGLPVNLTGEADLSNGTFSNLPVDLTPLSDGSSTGSSAPESSSSAPTSVSSSGGAEPTTLLAQDFVQKIGEPETETAGKTAGNGQIVPTSTAANDEQVLSRTDSVPGSLSNRESRCQSYIKLFLLSLTLRTNKLERLPQK
jgi:hypothetical protein